MDRALALVSLCLLAGACADPDATPVRATLADGQVLAGQVRTDTLFLESALGTLAIPLEDIGEVLPVEGGHLNGSSGYVTVWLRNGNEFRGKWADPELTMELSVGGENLRVDLPVNDLTRFQMQGGEVWPDGPVYRVRTAMGDDFLVDPDASRIAITNELGTFAPFLSECASILPNGDTWTLVLNTGTVLIGEVQGEALEFALDVGPESVTVPLDRIASMQWESWGAPDQTAASPTMSWEAASDLPADALEEDQRGSAVAPPRRSTKQNDGWFANEMLYDAKH